jgi:hypothetical protein
VQLQGLYPLPKRHNKPFSLQDVRTKETLTSTNSFLFKSQALLGNCLSVRNTRMFTTRNCTVQSNVTNFVPQYKFSESRKLFGL